MDQVCKIVGYQKSIPVVKSVDFDDIKKEFLDKENIIAIIENGETYILYDIYDTGLQKTIYGFYSIKPNKVLESLDADLDYLLDTLSQDGKQILIFEHEDDLFRWSLKQKKGVKGELNKWRAFKFCPGDRGEIVAAKNKEEALEYYKQLCGENIIEDLKEMYSCSENELLDKAIEEKSLDSRVSVGEDIDGKYLKGDYTLEQLIRIYIKKDWKLPALIGYSYN